MVGLFPEKQICLPSVGFLNFFQCQVEGGIFLYRIHHIRTELSPIGVYSSTPSLTVARSLEADERSAWCALIVLLRDVHPLLEASKCWKFLGWRGERNTLTGLCSSRAAFCSSFLWGGGEELPERSFRARRQLLCAGFPIQDVSAGVHLVRGSDCREEGNHQMLVSEQKMAGRDA